MRLKELKMMNCQMADAVKDKLSIKSIEKFGKNLDLWIEKSPNKSTIVVQPPADPPTSGAQITSIPESDLDSETSNDTNTTLNSTRMLKKRQLFSTNANLLINIQESEIETSYIKPPTPPKRRSRGLCNSPAGSNTTNSEDEVPSTRKRSKRKK